MADSEKGQETIKLHLAEQTSFVESVCLTVRNKTNNRYWAHNCAVTSRFFLFFKDPDVEEEQAFSTYSWSLTTTYKMLLGDYNTGKDDLAEHKVTLFFFIVFTYVVAVVLLNQSYQNAPLRLHRRLLPLVEQVSINFGSVGRWFL